MSKHEVSVVQFKRFYRDWLKDPKAMVSQARREISNPALHGPRRLQIQDGIVHEAYNARRRDADDMPMRNVTSSIAQLFCWWADGPAAHPR